MWAAITFSSLGDWLGLLANTALAQQLTHQQSVSTQGAAISGVGAQDFIRHPTSVQVIGLAANGGQSSLTRFVAGTTPER